MAVKKFHPRHKGKISDMIRKEINHVTKLEGENIVKLLDFHMGEKYQLLIYEYMENESLETALFRKYFKQVMNGFGNYCPFCFKRYMLYFSMRFLL